MALKCVQPSMTRLMTSSVQRSQRSSAARAKGSTGRNRVSRRGFLQRSARLTTTASVVVTARGRSQSARHENLIRLSLLLTFVLPCNARVPGAPPTRSCWSPGMHALLATAEAEDRFLTLKGVRTAAMMHLAIHDAINAIDPRFRRLRPRCGRPAARIRSRRRPRLRSRLPVDQYPAQRDRWESQRRPWLGSRMTRSARRERNRAGQRRGAGGACAKRENDRWNSDGVVPVSSDGAGCLRGVQRAQRYAAGFCLRRGLGRGRAVRAAVALAVSFTAATGHQQRRIHARIRRGAALSAASKPRAHRRPDTPGVLVERIRREFAQPAGAPARRRRAAGPVDSRRACSRCSTSASWMRTSASSTTSSSTTTGVPTPRSAGRRTTAIRAPRGTGLEQHASSHLRLPVLSVRTWHGLRRGDDGVRGYVRRRALVQHVDAAGGCRRPAVGKDFHEAPDALVRQLLRGGARMRHARACTWEFTFATTRSKAIGWASALADTRCVPCWRHWISRRRSRGSARYSRA